MLQILNITISIRYLFTFLLVALTITDGYSQNPLKFPRVASANVGVIVRDLASGHNVVEYNANKFLTPASITKCVTAAAIEMAGLADTTYTTKSFVRGNIDNDGHLFGDIIIQAVGDPTIESGRFPSKSEIINDIIKKLKHHGVKEITGGFEIDSLSFREQGPVKTWEIGDLRHAYGAGLYALNYNDNTSGGYSLVDPGEELLIALEQRLQSDSINVDWNDISPTPANLQLLVETKSPILAEILRITIEKSHNLYAEALLRKLAPWGFRRDALNRETELLKQAGIDTEASNIIDGSGLTRANSMTPDFMADILEHAYHQPWGERYLSYFPLAGKEGTVKKLLSKTPLAGKLALKSGSMNGVQTYAGYKLNNDGKPTHVVVIMVNDFSTPRAKVLQAIENFLVKQFQ